MSWHTIEKVRKEWLIFGRRVTFEWRSGKSPMGRFGGGWNWKVGVQVGGSSVILNLFVCMLRIEFRKRNG